jgi:hypothetical protein
LKAPPYVDQKVTIGKVSRAFEEGQCHMGIVCKDREDAHDLRDFCDDVHTAILGNKTLPPPFIINESSIVGVLTLEDVIERQLRVDILDERDRESAVDNYHEQKEKQHDSIKLEH